MEYGAINIKGWFLLSVQLSKTVSGLLLGLIAVGGIYGSFAYQEHQRAQTLSSYYETTASESEAAIKQTLTDRGLVRINGVIHTAKLNQEQAAAASSSQQCFPVNVNTSLSCEHATVQVIDLHHCHTLAKDVDCLSGGQIVISAINSKIEDVFISFNLLDHGQGDFTITIPEEASLQKELQLVFQQFVDAPQLANRHELNKMLFELFMNAKTNNLDEQLGQHFLTTFLSAVHHQLVVASIFE